jgi:hypothetical protein
VLNGHEPPIGGDTFFAASSGDVQLVDVLDSGFWIIRIIEGDCRWEAASLVDRNEIAYVEGDVLVVVPVNSVVVALDRGD